MDEPSVNDMLEACLHSLNDLCDAVPTEIAVMSKKTGKHNIERATTIRTDALLLAEKDAMSVTDLHANTSAITPVAVRSPVGVAVTEQAKR